MSGIDGSSIVKSGYLIKLATKSGKNWKKRYFMLNGNTLTYYADHNSLDKAKGDLLITAEAIVEDTVIEGKPHCCSIVTPFHTLVIAAKDTKEMKAWKKAIQNSIVEARTSIRGYITKVGGFLEGKHRKFFILHTSSITWHADHEHTSAVQGMMKLTASVTMSANDESNKIDLLEHATNNVLSLSFEQNTHEYISWKKGISKILKNFEEAKEETLHRIENAYDSAVMRGKLKVRPAKGGDDWVEHYFVLTMKELLMLEKSESGQTEVVDLYDIFPSCSVFETNLGQFAFELVTPRKVLHVKSDSREVTAAWIHNIRNAIAESEPDMTDPILQLAITKMEEDVFYDVSFHEDKPLGVVLERSGEWAIVKLSSFRDTGVSIGSALSSVNGESCILQPYQFAIGKLKNWKPPLHLGFRQSPKKNGYLVKLSRQRKGGSHRNWKTRYFSLGEGRLVYKDDDDPNASLKGDVPLMGSAVSLVSSSETGKFFCFRVVSGVTSLVMQGETQEEMMDWAATLYHAIAIANGGGHIISLERKRRNEEISFERKKLAEVELKRAKELATARDEEERLLREKSDEQAALAAQQAADEVAAAKRKAEEDAARLTAEENAAREEEERIRREQLARRERKIEEANCMLEGAIEIEDAPTLETAIAAVEDMDVADLVDQLPLAKQKLHELVGDGGNKADEEAARVKAEEAAAKIKSEQEEARIQAEKEAAEQEAARLKAEEEIARVKAEEEAAQAAAAQEEIRVKAEEEARLKAIEEAERRKEEEEAAKIKAAEDALLAKKEKEKQDAHDALASLLASPSLSLDSLDELKGALELAESCGAMDQNFLDEARIKVSVLNREKQNIEEVRNMLRSAIMNESLTSVEEALNYASSINYNGDEVIQAEELSRKWREEEERKVAEEEARLAKEAALLDEELATERARLRKQDSRDLSVVHEEGESEEDEDDEDDDEMSPGGPRDRRSSIADRVSSFSGSPSRGRPLMLERRASYADGTRKLGTIKERLQEDERRRHQQELHTLTTDEQLARFFNSYARVIDGFEGNEPLLTPVQFSSILRLVTGEKGNLFSEMKTFNK